MSRGACITLGIASALCAIGFFAVPFMGTKISVWGMLMLGSFCVFIAIACLVPRSRNITLRLIGGTVFVGCMAYVVSMTSGPVSTAQVGGPSLMKSIVALIVFGLPGGYVAIRGLYPTWGRASSAFLGHRRSDDGEAQPSLYGISSRGVRRIPDDAKVFVDGFSMSMEEWQEFTRVVAERFERDVPKWERLSKASSQWLVFIGAIALTVWMGWSPIAAGFLAVGSFVVSAACWYYVSAQRRSRIRWQVLAERGKAICVQCGYNLTGLESNRDCPECGWRRAS